MNTIPVNKSIRFINFIIDTFVSYIAVAIVLVVFYGDFENETLGLGKSTKNVAFLIGVYVYYLFFEFFFHKTIGKFITKTIVVKSDWSKITFFNILIRTLCRFFPIYWLPFLGLSNRGWHDIFSKTIVVSSRVNNGG